MKKFWLVMGVVLAPVTVQAQEGYPLFERLDTDGSGTVSLSEFEAGAAQMRAGRGDPAAMFARLDANEDGSIDAAEWARVADRMRNSENRPSPEAMMDRAFDKLDANGDGAISREEFHAGAAEMRARRGGNAGEMRGRMGQE